VSQPCACRGVRDDRWVPGSVRRSLDSVSVWAGEHDVQFLKPDGRGFYEILAEKILG